MDSKKLLDEWKINSPSIRRIISRASEKDKYELMGWIYANKDTLSHEIILKRIRTRTNKSRWDSDLYKEQKDKSILRLSQLIEPPDVEKGAYKCRKCGSERTVHISLQIRSSDEPMTNFITCVQCGERWKE